MRQIYVLPEIGWKNYISREFLHHSVTRQNFVLEIISVWVFGPSKESLQLFSCIALIIVLEARVRAVLCNSFLYHCLGFWPWRRLSWRDLMVVAWSVWSTLQRNLLPQSSTSNSIVAVEVYSTWTHSIEQLAWGASSFSASQEICCLLWKPKFKSPTLVHIMSQINPVHAFPSYSYYLSAYYAPIYA